MPDAARYRFGPFRLEPATRRLLRDSGEVTLPPKAFDLLVLLVRAHDRVLTKQELLDAVWPDTAVTENTLTQRVKEIREALGDEAQEPRYVGTVSRVGYRFVAEVTEERAEAAAPTAPPAFATGHHDASTGGHAAAPTNGPVYATAIVIALGGFAVWFGVPWRSAPVSDEPRHQLVSTFDGSHRSATLSPDGRMVAFLMDATGVPQVWIKSIASGSPVQITFGEVAAGRPRWSPRGDQILFERRDRGIWSVPPLGGEARQIIETGHSPNFSHDGSTIVFEIGRTNPNPIRWSLWLANADGSNRRQVQGTPDKQNWAEPAYPALSPDGQWIAFFRHTDGPRGDIWIVRASGGDAQALTFDEGQAGAPVWMLDSRAVVFPSERRGSRTLWRASIGGGPIETITTGAGSDDEPDISRDGRSLIYTSFKDHHALAVWDPATGTRKTIVTRALPLIMPDVSPQGDRVAFFVQGGADVQVFVARTDGEDVRQVTHGEGQENLHPSWSADGRFLYYYRHKPDRSFRRIGADGLGDAELVKGWTWATHNNASIDPTGRYVLYTRIGFDTGDYSKDTTYIYDLGNSSQRALEAPHLHMARWSPDGRHVAGWRHDGMVGVCEAASGRCRTLARGTRPQWSSDGSVVFVERKPAATHAEWWRINVADGAEELLGTVGPFHPLSPNVDVMRDNRVLFAEFGEGRRELWIRGLP
jgi:Tol biopolymer transport system component/DNA-binding winged helix-turn-helix (wHTH) protein